MKVQSVIGFIVVLAVADATSNFMAKAPHQASLVKTSSVQQKKEMPITKHDKNAGEGYQKGSPLYKKQEERKKAGVPAAPPPPPASPAGGAAVPTKPDDLESVVFSPYFLSIKGFTYFLSFVAWTFIIAFCWMQCGGGRNLKGYQEREVARSPYNFSYNLFSFDHCCVGGEHHVNVCACSWCCPLLRMADTYAKEPYPMMKFWACLALMACLCGLGPFTGGLTSLCFLIFAVVMRQKMRKAYGIDDRKPHTVFEDLVIWLCCPCCAIAQEARQSEFTLKKGQVDEPK